MSIMDLEGALAGGAPLPAGPAGPAGPLPAGLGAPLPGGPEGAPVPGEEQPAPTGSSLDFLLDAEEALQQFIQVDPDDADRSKASQALRLILDLKAANTQDAREGGLKSLSRALG